MQIAFQLDTIFGRKRFHFHLFFSGSFQKRKPTSALFLTGGEEKWMQWTCTKTHTTEPGSFCLAGGPDASEKTEGKTPSPTKNKGRKTQTPVWRARGELEPCSLSCSVLNSPWADAGWEERVPLGCGSQTGLVTAAFAFPWPPHSRCCPS